jgi:hypothetical protein
MNEEEQANLSDREKAINTKRKLAEMISQGLIKVPDHLAMYGLKSDFQTTYYFSTETRRSNFAVKLLTEDTEQRNLKFINPKR